MKVFFKWPVQFFFLITDEPRKTATCMSGESFKVFNEKAAMKDNLAIDQYVDLIHTNPQNFKSGASQESFVLSLIKIMGFDVW